MPPEPKQRLAKFKHFNVRAPNPEFPLLAFLWAVVAGGEHALYCDFTDDYADAYLIGRINEPDFAVQKERLMVVLRDLNARRDPNDPPQIVDEPTPAQWDTICQVLAEELKRGHMPTPVW